MFSPRSKVLASFILFALAAPAMAGNAPAASVDCKRAAQFEIFKRQLAMTDGGGTYVAASDMPKECAAKR